MSDIDFRTLNLNLLPALAALLRTRAVGRAARQVGVSQSAMSHSLAKLREAFGDPLLVAQGRSMVLTPRARELALSLPPALERLRESLAATDAFDPATATTTFTIATVDLFELTALRSLLGYLARHAPGVRLRIERLGPSTFEALRDGDVDVVIGGAGPPASAGLRRVVLFREPFKVIARSDHPGLGRRLTLASYLAYDHVLVRFEGREVAAVDRALASLGHQRRVGLSVPHFVAAPLAVAGSDMLSTVSSSVAAWGQSLLGLRLFDPPFELPAAPVSLWWAAAHDTDPARRWFRELLCRGDAAPPAIQRMIRATQERGPQ